MRACNTFIHVCIQYSEYLIDSTVYLCTHSSMFVHIHYGYIYIYIMHVYLQSSTTQCKLQIYTRMQVTPKIITLRYII